MFFPAAASESAIKHSLQSMRSDTAFIPDEIIPIPKPLFEGISFLMAKAKGMGEEVRGRLSGHGFSTKRREERRRMRSEFPRWGNERADESHALSLTCKINQFCYINKSYFSIEIGILFAYSYGGKKFAFQRRND